MGNHRRNMRESWGNLRGIVGEIETKVFCNTYRNKSILQQRTSPGKPVKRNSIRHILHEGEKITQCMCLTGNKSAQPRFTRASRGNFRTCENEVRRRRLIGPSSFWILSDALQFCFYMNFYKATFEKLE